MKAEKAPEIDIKAAVSELKKRKKALQDKENELTSDDIKIDRTAFETCLKKRFFLDKPSNYMAEFQGYLTMALLGVCSKIML